MTTSSTIPYLRTTECAWRKRFWLRGSRPEDFTLTETVNGIFFRGFATWEFKGGDGITTFGVQFRRGGCTVEVSYDNDSGIRSSWWPVVRRTWDLADYILTVKGSCNL